MILKPTAACCVMPFIGMLVPLSVEAERGLYTAEKIASMRENLARYDWAREVRDRTVAKADKVAVWSDVELATWVPDPRIPRAIYVHETGCPNCGLECRKYGNYPWLISGDKPWKVECPNCHNIYPSNDFQAFLETDFQDRSLLTGDHPDDGFGWKSPDHAQKYWFVAWYNQWMIARRLLPAITDLSEAYLYTDNPRYAHKCAVLLWQLARYYPDYDYVNQSRYGLEIDRGYHGKLQYHTWECFTVDVCARAYDAISPALRSANPELEALTGQSTDTVRRLIEEQLLRAMAREIVNKTRYIAGNYGMHQKGLLQIAAILRDSPGVPDRRQMVEWILNNQEYGLYTFMPIYDALYNLVYRDGCPYESPGYNLHWVVNLSIIAEQLRQNGVDIFSHPRFKKLYDWPLDLICAGNFTPSLGDSGNMSNRGHLLTESVYLPAYRAYRNPLYAGALLRANPEAGNDIWERPLGEELKTAAATLQGELGYANRHLAGYGLAILQGGDRASPFAVALFYGQFIGHSKRDKMHLDIFAEDCSMIPGFGYPETANSNDPRRAGFFWNTVSHNTVIVDERMQEAARGRCLAYDPGLVCQHVEARNDGVYPQCDTYRRGVTTVEISPTQRYIVDIFRVAGGRQHDWIIHGTHADLTSNLEISAPRPQGTLAGPEVRYGQFYDDPILGAAAYGTVGYFGYRGSGYQFLFNVQEAPLQRAGYVKFNIITGGERAAKLVRANDGAFLKAHLLGDDEHILICDGIPQKNQPGTPDTVKFILRRRKGKDLRSTFITVFEPGAKTELISGVERIDVADGDLVVLKIILGDGGTDYYFHGTQETKAEVDGVCFSGQVGYVSLDGRGTVRSAYLYNGSRLSVGDWNLRLEENRPWKAMISGCDYAANRITLDPPVPADRFTPGATVIVDAGAYGSSFTLSAAPTAGGIRFGDQCPIMARARITGMDPAAGKLQSSTIMHFAQPGLHVVNEAWEPVGQVKSTIGGLTLDRPFAAERFADRNGDGMVHAYLMEYGPGDRVEIPAAVRYQRDRDH